MNQNEVHHPPPLNTQKKRNIKTLKITVLIKKTKTPGEKSIKNTGNLDQQAKHEK